MLEFLFAVLVISMLWVALTSIEKLSVSVTWRDETSKGGTFLKRMVAPRSQTETWEWKRIGEKDVITHDFRRK
jgi:hypothetical protein